MAGWATSPGSAFGGAPPERLGPPPLSMVVRTRPLEAIVVGLAAAALASLAWWAVAATTERLFVYGAILVGVLVGQGVLIGARKGGPVPALLAIVFTLVSLAVAQYFISRSLAISTLGAADVPLWQGFSFAYEAVRSSIDDDGFIVVFWFISAIVAMVSAGRSSRRPVL